MSLAPGSEQDQETPENASQRDAEGASGGAEAAGGAALDAWGDPVGGAEDGEPVGSGGQDDETDPDSPEAIKAAQEAAEAEKQRAAALEAYNASLEAARKSADASKQGTQSAGTAAAQRPAADRAPIIDPRVFAPVVVEATRELLDDRARKAREAAEEEAALQPQDGESETAYQLRMTRHMLAQSEKRSEERFAKLIAPVTERIKQDDDWRNEQREQRAAGIAEQAVTSAEYLKHFPSATDDFAQVCMRALRDATQQKGGVLAEQEIRAVVKESSDLALRLSGHGADRVRVASRPKPIAGGPGGGRQPVRETQRAVEPHVAAQDQQRRAQQPRRPAMHDFWDPNRMRRELFGERS